MPFICSPEAQGKGGLHPSSSPPPLAASCSPSWVLTRAHFPGQEDGEVGAAPTACFDFPSVNWAKVLQGFLQEVKLSTGCSASISSPRQHKVLTPFSYQVIKQKTPQEKPLHRSPRNPAPHPLPILVLPSSCKRRGKFRSFLQKTPLTTQVSTAPQSTEHNGLVSQSTVGSS